MANQANAKLKLLKIWEYLRRESDEDNVKNTGDILEFLEKEGITSERKSIYSDIRILQDYGVDIVRLPGPAGGYYIGSRDFELPEVKLLADAVAASKFMTEKRSRSLLKKLETLVSSSDAHILRRQVIVSDRAKTENEAVVYAIDVIHNCIEHDRKMGFCYSEWTPEKKKALRHNGQVYLVSPAYLLWDNENYYLVAYDDNHGQIRHYRVDKIVKAFESEEKRGGREQRKAIRIADYSQVNFGMYAGETETVSIRIKPDLVSVFLDRFGTDISIHPEGDDYVVHILAAVSPQFFGWLAGLGERAVILGPESVRTAYKDHLEAILCQMR